MAINYTLAAKRASQTYQKFVRPGLLAVRRDEQSPETVAEKLGKLVKLSKNATVTDASQVYLRELSKFLAYKPSPQAEFRDVNMESKLAAIKAAVEKDFGALLAKVATIGTEVTTAEAQAELDEFLD